MGYGKYASFQSKYSNYSIRLLILVPQDDIVFTNLTVRENLEYSALLRLPSCMSLLQKKAIVDEVIQVLELGPVQHNVVGPVEKQFISGGQRKRTNM